MNLKVLGLTLIELIIAIILMSLIIMGLANIDVFSHFHVLSASRRTTVQNELTMTLDHMTKNIQQAIGPVIPFPVTIGPVSGNPGIRVWVDGNLDGRLDAADDHEIAYSFAGYQILYFNPCCAGGEVIAKRITDCNWALADNYYLGVQLRACWDPLTAPTIGDSPSGTTDNPCVVMNTNIRMPSVAAH